jgi:hypothetical protein
MLRPVIALPDSHLCPTQHLPTSPFPCRLSRTFEALPFMHAPPPPKKFPSALCTTGQPSDQRLLALPQQQDQQQRPPHFRGQLFLPGGMNGNAREAGWGGGGEGRAPYFYTNGPLAVPVTGGAAVERAGEQGASRGLEDGAREAKRPRALYDYG